MTMADVDPPLQLECGNKVLDLSRPRIMGVINITPDSFSDGGEYFSAEAAIARARALVAQGADIIDIGGESTRPNATPVAVAHELQRVIPVIEVLARLLEVPISIDTSKPAVMHAAARAGAGMINDVYALQAAGAETAAAATGLPVCLMHMQGEPRTMQNAPHYDDVVAEVGDFLSARAEAVIAAGVRRERIILDPGFGFGKNLQHNYQLLNQLPALVARGYPVLAGMSRKAMIKAVVPDAAWRTISSATAATLAVLAGARIVRVHDVAETAAALAIATATQHPDKLVA